MSQLADAPITAPVAKSEEDIFKALSEGDQDDTLDLTKPPKVKEEKPKDEKPKEEPKEDEEDKEDKEDKEDEEDDELKELEEELNLEDADEDEETELVTPVPRKAILKKYPNLFK